MVLPTLVQRIYVAATDTVLGLLWAPPTPFRAFVGPTSTV